MNSALPAERFVVLDGMRGLAALAVITDHVHSPIAESLLPGRYLAVDFFFALSGFVLMHVYGQRLTQKLSWGAFMRLRLIRFYPLYIVGVLAGAAFWALHAVKGWNEATLEHVAGSLVFAAAFLPTPPNVSIWPDAPFPLNGPSWSLFFELFINAVFAAIVVWLTPRRSALIALAAAVGLVAFAYLSGEEGGGHRWSNFLGGFGRVTLGFFAGVCIYQLRAHFRAPVLPAWAGMLILMAAMMVHAPGPWRLAIDVFASVVVFPFLVMSCADSRADGWFGRACAWIGAMSYGVYVLHVPLWGWLRLSMENLGVSLPGLANVALVGVLALAAAWLLDKYYDAPARAALMRRRRKAA
ncbi:MAG TPA: acyltransferase [Terricaulis sp.]|nr:acyltransferase [Terricaulis sp.]